MGKDYTASHAAALVRQLPRGSRVLKAINPDTEWGLTEQLLGSRLSKKFPVGQTLRLPIRGTIDRPQVETGPILTFLKENAIIRASQKVSQRLTKALQKTGEAGLEVGGAAGDVAGEAIEALGNGAEEAEDALDKALKKLFKKQEGQ